MAATLFGGSNQSTSKNLVEFRAGKMFMKDKTVHPDKRKGLVYVHQTEDTLMHFCWKDRTSGAVEEDLIIFPEDVEFKKVAQSPNGRVYILRFKSNNRRFFFWMQEPKTDKDEEYCRKVNEFLNNPPAPGSQRSSGSSSSSLGGSDLSNLQNPDISSFIGNISQQQLMQILGSGVPNLASLLGTNSPSRTSSSSSSTTTSSTSSNTSTTTSAITTTSSTTTTSGSSKKSTSGRQIQLQDLQNILSGIGSSEESNNKEPVDLGPAMTSEALQPILSNPEFVEKLRTYLPSTGETLPPAEQLKGTLTSPQFKQAVNLFSAALQSGELGPLISQFGLGQEAVMAAASSDMEAFVAALSKKQKSDKDAKNEDKKDEDKDDDDAMALD